MHPSTVEGYAPRLDLRHLATTTVLLGVIQGPRCGPFLLLSAAAVTAVVLALRLRGWSLNRTRRGFPLMLSSILFNHGLHWFILTKPS